MPFSWLSLSIQRFGFLFHNLKPIFIVLDFFLADMAAFKCHFYNPNSVFHITGAESLHMEEIYCMLYYFEKKKEGGEDLL